MCRMIVVYIAHKNGYQQSPPTMTQQFPVMCNSETVSNSVARVLRVWTGNQPTAVNANQLQLDALFFRCL